MRRGGHRGAGISAQLVGVPLITKRLVFHVGGYDPMSPEAAYRRFNRELRRFETTWGAKARTTEAEVTPDEVRWRVVTRGPDWDVETVYHLVRWDDVIQSDWKRSDWRRIPSGLLASLTSSGTAPFSAICARTGAMLVFSSTPMCFSRPWPF